MGEADRRDHLLDLRVGRIFVELLILNRSAEIRRTEGVRVVLEQDVRRKELTVELYIVVLPYRPIVPWGEDQLRVTGPSPYTRKRGGDRDSGSNVLSNCA